MDYGDALAILLGILVLIFMLGFFAFIAGIIYLGIRLYREARLRKEQILEQWDVLIAQANGNMDVIYNSTAEALEAAEPPGVKWQREKVALGAFSRKRYDVLVVHNSHLRRFSIYLIALDYGNSLQVAWFLTIRPGLYIRLLAGFFSILGRQTDSKTLATVLDIPRELEVHAYTTTVHAAAKEAVQALMTQLEQDFSKVSTKSKGFLEIW